MNKIFLLLTLILLLCSCEPAQMDLLISAENRWQSSNIDSYQIEVRVVNSIWHLQTHQITVENGVVTDAQATCDPAPFERGECEVRTFTPEDFTVTGLFDYARTVIERPDDDNLVIAIEYDPTNGVPTRISTDNTLMTDDDTLWQVISFEMLEP